MAGFIFTGAVEESLHALEELIRQGAKPAMVCTIKPEFSHRHSDYADLRPLAAAHGIPVLDFDNMNEPPVVEAIRAAAPDYLLVIGWSQLLREDLLAIPRYGSIGFHPTALPQGRGRAAIPWTILTGATETGASMMYLDDGVDSGDLVAQVRIPVEPDEVARTLYDKICAGLCQMVSEIAPYLRDGKRIPGTPQDHSRATYYAKRVANDGWIEWNDDAEAIHRLIRAVGKPYPGAFTIYGNTKLTIWESRLRQTCNQIGTVGQILTISEDAVTVQCGEGWLDLISVQDENTPEPVPAGRYFTRLHSKLGINAYDLWRKLNAAK